MNRFDYSSAAHRVVFGAGALDQLPDLLGETGWRRLLLCTSRSQTANGTVGRLRALLGPRLVAVFDDARAHVPLEQVETAVTMALEQNVDGVIGLGGGSAVGLAKAVSFAIEEAWPAQPPEEADSLRGPRIPVLAIPTTYAGSEMTPIYGTSQAAPGVENGPRRKRTVRDPRITPRLVLYDPQLTLDLPPEVTAASGVNALAHCIEAVYSTTKNPLSTAAALRGARIIYRALPAAVAQGRSLPARAEMLAGAHLAAVAVVTASIGLHHGLCHVLGGAKDVPHGTANSIMLPHAVRFNLETEEAPLREVARALGLADPQALPDALHHFIGSLGLPQRLRDVGVAEEDLPALARMAMESTAVQNNPRPLTGPEQAEAVYRAAW
ncbi:MAG TPA: iron-containing alcohol dehydrogenase [Candidatus Sulfomarinibacteraceae bacterium]|nr:iron-containing alcohol dehydrogenase [Candidatus Sulfomarinibacteraceae bacterium]